MSAERMSRPRARQALAGLLFTASLAFAGIAASAETPAEAFDFEVAGGASVVGEMHRRAMEGVREYCSGLSPETVADWRRIGDAWNERNAPWLVASAKVNEITMRKVAESGEDMEALRKRIEQIIAEFADKPRDMIRGMEDASARLEACNTMRGSIDEGAIDVSRNEYKLAIDMLRDYLE